jgi:hypothetical protein
MKLLPNNASEIYPLSDKLGWNSQSGGITIQMEKYVSASKGRGTGDIATFIKVIKADPPKFPMSAWFARNILLDTLQFYYRALAEYPKFNYTLENYRKSGPKAYEMLKGKEFNNHLDKIAKETTTGDIINITPDIKEMLENTYNEAKRLEKQMSGK